MGTGELERRRRLRVRLRPNLVITEQREAGRLWYAVKDPLTLSYFQLDEGQCFAVGLMDGKRTLADIQAAYEEKYRPERLPLEELEGFAGLLLDAGLAKSESPLAGPRLAARADRQRRQARWSTWLNFLALKLPLLDPDRLLGGLAPRCCFLFTTAGVLAGLGLVLAALDLVGLHWDALLAKLPAPREFFTATTLLYLWLAVGLAKVLHELGHGICCKLQGGEVHEMGVLFLFFFPTLYCDVSDSWTLSSKWRRMAIAAAGIYIDLLLAALATFAWWASAAGTLVHELSFALMLACSAGTLVWNANPLLRFDGYYVLADWLEVPNLAERSTRLVQAACLRWLGLDVPAEPVPSRSPGLLVGYSIARYVYRLFVLVGLLYFLFTFLKPYKLDAVGCVLGGAALLVTVAWPAWGVLQAVMTHRRWPELKPARAWLVLVGLSALVVLFFTLPLPWSVRGLALVEVEPDAVSPVVVPETGGFLQAVRVRDGQRVRAGDVLAILSNPKVEIRLRVNEVDQALRSRQRSERLGQLADAEGPADQAVVKVQQSELELSALVREHRLLRRQQDELTLRAPCDGVVMRLVSPQKTGQWLEKGTELCRLGDPQALRVVLLIDPADHRLVQPGSPAQVRVHGLGAERWHGTVTDVAQVDAKRIPPQLSSRAGGDVATQADASGADRPRVPCYLAAVRLQGGTDLLQSGVLGRVKIEVASQTGWWRLRRFLAQTFSWGL